jgi:hypothetical protein
MVRLKLIMRYAALHADIDCGTVTSPKKSKGLSNKII